MKDEVLHGVQGAYVAAKFQESQRNRVAGKEELSTPSISHALTAVTLDAMERELLGLWNSNLYDGTVLGPAEEDLIFKPDGTGHYVTINYFPECADLFHWFIPSPGLLTMRGYKRLLADYEGGFTEEETWFGFENIPYRIHEHKNPRDTMITVLAFDLPDRATWAYPGCFMAQWGLIRKDVSEVDEPDFSRWKKLSSAPETSELDADNLAQIFPE